MGSAAIGAGFGDRGFFAVEIGAACATLTVALLLDFLVDSLTGEDSASGFRVRLAVVGFGSLMIGVVVSKSFVFFLGMSFPVRIAEPIAAVQAAFQSTLPDLLRGGSSGRKLQTQPQFG